MDDSRDPDYRPANDQIDIEGRIPEPFPLVRYYLIASVALVLVTFGALTFFSIRIERNSVINRLEEEAAVAVQPFAFDMSLAVTDLVGPEDDITTQVPALRDQLNRATLNAIRGDPIVRVDLMTLDGELIYSTDESAVRAISPGEARDVGRGASLSRYIDDERVVLFNGDVKNVDTVVTAMPLSTEWSVGSGGAVAVLVTHRDVTSAVAAATSSSMLLRLGAVAGPLLALFLVLFWIVARGQKFTAQAREELSGMLRREIDIRQQLDARNVELQQANRAKSQFFSMVSHELKTPLTAIIAFSSRLNKRIGPTLEDRDGRQLEAVARNGVQLKGLIEDLLDVSAAESGKLKLSFEPLKVSDLMSHAIDLSQPLMDAKAQSMEASVSEVEGVEIVGDFGRLQQAITNLLSNASKYSPEGSNVSVTAGFDGEQIQVSVSDEGMGISEEDQKMLFSAFFRTSDAVSSGTPGTGLGLVVVRSIVQGHGGDIRVESESGRGSTFHVTLPLDASKGGTAMSSDADTGDQAA